MSSALALLVGLLAIPLADLDTRRWLARWWNKPRPAAPPHRGGGYRPRADTRRRSHPQGSMGVPPRPWISLPHGDDTAPPPNFGSHARTDAKSVAERRAWLEGQRLRRPAPNPAKAHTRRM